MNETVPPSRRAYASVMKRAALFLLAIASIASADQPADARLYVKQALASEGMIKDPVERRFLERTTDWSLLAFLGYVSDVPKEGSVDPWFWAQMDRMRLQETFEARIDNRTRFIYVFAASKGHPGWNNTCVVLTDETGYLLDWRGRKQSEMFESAKYADGMLELTCKRRTTGKSIYRYNVTVESIDSCGRQ